MWNKRKFRKGERLVTEAQISSCLSEERWIYLHGVPKHPSIIANMSFATVLNFLRHGMLHYAVKNEEPKL